MKRDTSADLRRAIKAYVKEWPAEAQWAEGIISHVDAERTLQPSLFDASAGKKLKSEGMALAEANRAIPLGHARELALEIAIGREDHKSWIDLVYTLAEKRGIDLSELRAAAGSVYKDKKKWVFVGDHSSERTSNHARQIMVWRLRQEWLDANPEKAAAKCVAGDRELGEGEDIAPTHLPDGSRSPERTR